MKNLMKMGKKGQLFGQLSGLTVGLLGLVLVMIVAFIFLSQIKANSQVAADSNATLAVNTLTDAANDIPGWVPLIVLGVIATILLGLVGMFATRAR